MKLTIDNMNSDEMGVIKGILESEYKPKSEYNNCTNVACIGVRWFSSQRKRKSVGAALINFPKGDYDIEIVGDQIKELISNYFGVDVEIYSNIISWDRAYCT